MDWSPGTALGRWIRTDVNSAFRPGDGLGAVRRASRVLTEGPVFALLCELREKFEYSRPVRGAVNAMVHVPSVSGILSPMILRPTCALTGIPAEQLRAILLHELAHIRRHDYLINLCQQVIEALLFFNPSVWWINRQIRFEREACCDLLAAEASSQKAYATALAQFAERALDARGPVLEPAFPGDGKPSTLIERMRRLLVSGYQPVVRLPWHSSLGVLFFAGFLLFGAWR